MSFMEMRLTKIPIKKNDFREEKYISFPGQGVRIILWFGVQVAVTVKLIGAYSLLVWPKGDTQLSSGLRSKSLEMTLLWHSWN